MNEIFQIGFISVTWIDFVDIFIVSLFFYWVYRSLRSTAAVQILVGLVILVGVSFVVNSANLKALSWVINAIAGIWLLAFIVLFQPELRRVLFTIVQSRFFRLFVRTSISEILDEVLDTVKELSEKHIGALIVFTSTHNVKVAVETGISLQALVSTELLVSIFNPRSPLHDGAVIINDKTVVAARCVLPLSNIKRIGNKNLGTRHRAALGLSEQSDVLVLVVSEETGGVSIAQFGELHVDIPKKELRSTLTKGLALNLKPSEQEN